MSTTVDQPLLEPSPYPPIERILLARGTRGMDKIARHLPPDYCARAARAVWGARGRVLLTTGFYVAGHPETDGPPGTFFLARGLAQTGAHVAFVSEQDTLSLLRALAGAMWPANVPAPEYLPFPILNPAASRDFAARLTDEWQPSLIAAVERCGRAADGHYHNRRGRDITPYTAQVDDLFATGGAVTVGVGDGGNEIGMGCVTAALTADLAYPRPCVTPADHLVVATVSNWGAYGLLAYIGELAGRNLLPGDDESVAALRLLADLGAVNGMSGQAEPLVDGFPPEVEAQVLGELRVAAGGL
jgi:hypothetical protein